MLLDEVCRFVQIHVAKIGAPSYYVCMETKIIRPFNDAQFTDIKKHVTEVRRLFDWPGIPYHDVCEGVEAKFNRWYWHNLPLLRSLHNDPDFIRLACETFGTKVQPSYVFLSMYGPDGVCPPHTDRPQCLYTIDLAVNQDGTWPIYIGENQGTTLEDCKPFILQEGEAIAYSGVNNRHYRKSMNVDSEKILPGKEKTVVRATYTDLVFFHFADIRWQGEVK
jgi:hypothetical protein